MELLSKAAFARLIGRDKSWVTRAAQQGRIVLEGQGRLARVRVQESKTLLEASAGNRDDVAQRHAENRNAIAANPGAGAANGAPDNPSPPDSPDRPPEAAKDGSDPQIVEARRAKVIAESRRAQAAADREEMERDKLAGDLIAREDVDAAMKFIGASVFSLLDVFADQTAPIVAPIGTIEGCHAALTEACRNTLVKLGEAIEQQKAALQRKAA